jgi:hypothetical protein
VRELKGKFGHDFGAIAKRAAYLGLFFEDEDLVVLDLMAKTDAVIRSRYIRSGAFTIPHPDALHRTCRSLHQSVGEELQKAGQPVRLRPYSRRRNRGHDARR